MNFKSPKSLSSMKLWISTVPLPIIITLLSLTFTATVLIPEFWIWFAISAEIICPFSTSTSPVCKSMISSKASWFVILVARLNFILNLCLPTFAKSYLFGSKNNLSNNVLAASIVGNSPGLNFL